LERHFIAIVCEPGNCPTFPHFGTRGSGMFKQQVVKSGALNLEGSSFARETPVLKNQLERFGGIADMKLRAQLNRKARSFKRRDDTHFFEDAPVIWKERLADVKTRKMFLFEKQNAAACAGEEGSRSASTRPTANHQRIIQT
jgi:hypothetical protein